MVGRVDALHAANLRERRTNVISLRVALSPPDWCEDNIARRHKAFGYRFELGSGARVPFTGCES
jgi:hypothetical protein